MKTDKYAKIVEPSIQSARKRLNKITNTYRYQIADELIGIGNFKTYVLK